MGGEGRGDRCVYISVELINSPDYALVARLQTSRTYVRTHVKTNILVRYSLAFLSFTFESSSRTNVVARPKHFLSILFRYYFA